MYARHLSEDLTLERCTERAANKALTYCCKRLWNKAENLIKRKIYQMVRGQTTRLFFFLPVFFNNAQGKKGVEYHCSEWFLCVCPSPLEHKSLKENKILSRIFLMEGADRK